MSKHHVSIEIANRRLKVACPKGQESALLLAADEVNQRLNKDSKKNTASKSPEQMMVMTALNLANDLLASKQKLAQQRKIMQTKIDLLQTTIEQAVNTEQQNKA